MTFNHPFASNTFRPAALTATVFFAASVLAGCGTSGVVDATSVIAQPRLPAPGSATFTQNKAEGGIQQTGAPTTLDATATRASDQAPRVSGAYPNLNIRPGAAAAQFTPEESQALATDLRGQQGRLNAANVDAANSVTSPDEMRRIGAAHGDNTLQAIENQAAQ